MRGGVVVQIASGQLRAMHLSLRDPEKNRKGFHNVVHSSAVSTSQTSRLV